jgi:hypothetical protein
MQLMIDTESLVSQFDISRSQIEALINYVVDSITASYAERLEYQAKQHLHSTRKIYISNIKVFNDGRFKGVVLLDYTKAPLVRMLEEGAQPFDEKLGFSRSDKRHLKKDGSGWYLTIPWREANPNAVAEDTVFNGGAMPKEVYDIISNKPADVPTSTGGMRSDAILLKELPSKYQLTKTRAQVKNEITNQTFEAYKNKTSIYEGISKIEDQVTGQNIYMSFRRVSDKSDPNSWIFTGIQAFNLMDKAMDDLQGDMQQELSVATDNALKSLGIIS